GVAGTGGRRTGPPGARVTTTAAAVGRDRGDDPVGQQHDRQQATVRRGAEADLDAVPLRQLRHDVQTDLGAVVERRHVRGGRGGQQLVRLFQGVRLHAHAGVLDLHRDAALDLVAGDPDGGARWGEGERVVEQFG